MKTIRVNASTPYDVLIEDGLLEKTGELVAKITEKCKAFIVSDDIVFSLYGNTVKESLEKAGFLTESFVFPNGERHKSLDTVSELLEKMCLAKMTRTDIVIALGGGVCGDMTGFAAAVYLRGVPFVQIPTTLLAAVDASVGGKTGVDLKEGKNQVGAFWQPSLVICDPLILRTLSREQYNCGCAEVIKYAVIASEKFFAELLETPVYKQYEHVIYTCVSIKRDFVEQDEHDTGVRMALNFGHTFGHAVEAYSDYALLHGQGVAIGMVAAARGACKNGVCSEETYRAIKDIIKKYHLPTRTHYEYGAVRDAILIDKKNAGDHINLILPEKIGKYVIKQIKKTDIDKWFDTGEKDEG